MRFLKVLGCSLQKIRHDQRGNVLVLFGAYMTVMMALAAISVDVGRIYATRQRYKIVADGSAFAGATRLPDQTAARAAATHVLQANRVDPALASISFSPDGAWIYVSIQASMPTTFARVLGIGQVSVPATTSARSAPTRRLTGVIPIGVPQQTFIYGQKVTLKYGTSGGGSRLGPGNFGALVLGGNGADSYRNDFENGYRGVLSRGDRVQTQPGNMAGPTADGCNARMAQETEENDENYDDNHQFEGEEWGQNGYNRSRTGSRRVVFLPVIDDSAPHGGSEVEVVGFAAFHLEGCQSGEVTGRFLRTVTEAEMDDSGPDYGLHSVKLGG